MLWVRPGVFEVRASPLRRRSELIRDDLPTLDRPRKEISGLTSATQPAPVKGAGNKLSGRNFDHSRLLRRSSPSQTGRPSSVLSSRDALPAA